MKFLALKGRGYFVKALFLINFIYTLHFTLAVYINSSYLSNLLGGNYALGLLYAISAVLAIFILSFSEKILIKFGIFKSAVVLLIFDIVSLLVLTISAMGIFNLPKWFILVFFVIYYSSSVFLFRFILDVYLEENSKKNDTGILRGEFLTVGNIAWFVSPSVAGLLLSDGDFWKVYAVAFSLAIILLILIITGLEKQKDVKYEKIYFTKSLMKMVRNENLRDIFIINFLMYLYFSWMVIYMPIYLNENLGIPWRDIGLFIFPVMLLPYVLVDIPIGFLADKYFGEKKFIIAGVLITTIATIPIAFIETGVILIWAVILFATRIGTSIIEIMTDVYFFKYVDAEDSNLISIYRNSQPLAYIAGPILATTTLIFSTEIQHLFPILASVMFFGIIFALKIKDIK